MRKKIKFFIILLTLFMIPCIVLAEECNSSSITLESIELKSINGYAEELNNASIDGKKVNLDLKLYDPGDSIEYNLKVKNTSNEDFYIDEGSLKSNNDYLEYHFTYDDNSNVVKANKEKNMIIKVQYKNRVPTELLTNNVYNYTNNVVLNLSNQNNNLVINPNTGNILINCLMILFIITLLFFIITKKKKTSKLLFLIIGSIIIIPTIVQAICKCEVELEAKIQIVEENSILVYPEGKTKETVTTGDIVKINMEEFYVLKKEGRKLFLLTHYNLNVGPNTKAGDTIGKQDPDVYGCAYNHTTYGNIIFSNTNYWIGQVGEGKKYPGSYSGPDFPYVYDENSEVYQYVENYKSYLTSIGATIEEARLPKYSELADLGCKTYSLGDCRNEEVPAFVKETTYWIGNASYDYNVYFIRATDAFDSYVNQNQYPGVRPVIVLNV